MYQNRINKIYKINVLHETFIMTDCQNFKNFEIRLSLSQYTTKIYKQCDVQGSQEFSPIHLLKVFNTRNKLNYNLRHASYFGVPLINFIYNGTESILIFGIQNLEYTV